MINNTALVCFVIWIAIPWIIGPIDCISGYSDYADAHYSESAQAMGSFINLIIWGTMAFFIYSKINPKEV
jgi:hypothetical protein